MMKKALAFGLVAILISSLAVLASSGWTLQGNSEKQTPIKAHILTGSLTFLSSPNTTVEPNHLYQYQVIPSDYNATLELTWLTPEWNQLLIINWTLIGAPNATNIGLTMLSLKLTLDANTSYQNFTIQVLPVDQFTRFGLLGLGLAFVFIFLFLGIKNPIFMFIDGILWFAVALTIFMPYGDLFLYSGLGVGIITMIEGGFRIGN